MQLQSLEDHCAAIAKAIDNADLCRIDDRWTVLLADWLSIAAGIVSLEYDHFRVDRLAGYCESADAWEGVREKILTGFVTSLVKFSLVWGALEAAITIIEPPSSGLTRGKINAACFYLLKHFGVGASISGYRPALAAFLETARERYGADVLKKEVRLRDDLGISGIGLRSVYLLRNQFAHGGLEFPIPTGAEVEEERAPSTTIDFASRLILLSIQMLLIAYIASQSIDDADFQNGLKRLEIELRRAHVKRDRDPIDSDQLTFEFGDVYCDVD